MLYLRGCGFYAKSIFFICNIIVLLSYNSVSWRRYILKCLCFCASAWGSKLGLLCGTSGRRKLCMMPCHSCHIYGIWKSKEVGKALKPLFGVAMQAIRRKNFYGEEGVLLCNATVLKLYCKSYWVL